MELIFLKIDIKKIDLFKYKISKVNLKALILCR